MTTHNVSKLHLHLHNKIDEKNIKDNTENFR